MSSARSLFVYHSRQMLFTLDLAWALEVLINELGEPILLREMTAEERAQAQGDDGPIPIIHNRFYIFAVSADGALHRERELEHKIVAEGQK